MKVALVSVGIALQIALSPPADAMAVGDVAVSSALNAPLLARVPIARKADEAPLLAVRLAPASAYTEAGLQPPGVALDAFSLDWRATQQGAELELRSSRVINEPFLTLLLDLRTAKGVQRFALDLLIDATAAADAPRTRYGPVRAGETLSVIAETLALRHGSSLNLMLAALKRLNPQAFAGSVHNLLEGAVLRVPTDADLRMQAHLHQSVRWYRDAGAPPQRTQRRPGTPANGEWWWRSADGKPAVIYVSDLMFPLEVGFWSYRALAEAHFHALKSAEQLEPWLFQLDWTLESMPVPIDPETTIGDFYARDGAGIGTGELTEQGAGAGPSIALGSAEARVQADDSVGVRSPRGAALRPWPVQLLMSAGAFVFGLIVVAALLAGVHGRVLAGANR